MSLFRIPLGLLTWVLSLEISQAQLRIGEDTTLIFAAVDDARKILTSRDDFMKRLIGFEKCDEVEIPAELKSRKITNPDAPANDHIILLKILGKDVWAVPILFSRAERYDSTRGGEFFSYLQFKFLVVERDATSTDVKPIYDDGKPRLVDLEQVSSFHEQVGRNTAYIIHPEEILADNFALLVLGESEVPTPRVIEGMKQRLKSTKLTGPAAPGSEEAR